MTKAKSNTVYKEHIHSRDVAKAMARKFFAIESVLRCESVDTVFAQMTMDLLPKDAENLFPAEELDDKDALSLLIDHAGRRGRRITWIDVVDRLLAVMAEKPETYAEDIRRIGQKHGGLFITPEQCEKLQAHAQAIQDMLAQAGLPAPTGAISKPVQP